MLHITTKDGTSIYHKDWGKGQPVVFSHGWPLTSDAWESQMFFLASNEYRCIAHDRRGHGRSGQPWDGNHMDQYADDLEELFDKLNLKDIVMIGHSTGGGEVARYIGRYGTKRVAKAVLMGGVPPLMLKTAANPGGLSSRIAHTPHLSSSTMLSSTPRMHERKKAERPLWKRESKKHLKEPMNYSPSVVRRLHTESCIAKNCRSATPA